MTTELSAGTRGQLLRSILADRQPAEPADRPRRTEGPATFAQEQLWFLDQLLPDTPNYNVPFVFTLDGPLDAEALSVALRELANRHDALRTVLRSEPAGLRQQVLPELELPLRTRDLSGAADPAAEGWRICRELVGQPFRLTEPPLWRAELLRLDPAGNRHLLAWVASHAIADGWSIGLFIRELSLLYPWARAGRRTALPAPRLQLIDYAEWQRAELTEQRMRQLLDYWSGQLAGAAPLNFPYDHPRPSLPSAAGRTATFPVTEDLLRLLGERSRELQQTPFTLALAGYLGLLMRYCGHRDISVGIPVAGRDRAEHDELMGSLVNTLVIRLNPVAEPTFGELVEQTALACRGAFEHAELPFGKLVERLRPARPGAQSPLCNTVFSFGSTPFADAEHWLDDVRLGFRGVSNDTVRFDFELALDEQDGGWSGRLEYSVELFEAGSAELFCRRYLQLLHAGLAEPDRPLSELLAADADTAPSDSAPAGDPLGGCAEQLATELELAAGRLIGWDGAPDAAGARLAARLAEVAGCRLQLRAGPDDELRPDCWLVDGRAAAAARPSSATGVLVTGDPDPIQPNLGWAERGWLVRLLDDSGLALVSELTGPEDGQLLGRPASGTVAEVVDQRGRPVPARMAGRLRIRPTAGGNWIEPGWQVHRLADGRLACVVREVEPAATPSSAGGGERLNIEAVEQRLTELWCRALERDGIGREEDFFTAGGHSVLGAQLVAQIRDELHCDISLLDFFGAPSIAELSELICQRSEAEPEVPAELLEQVARLSDEEVRRLLEQLGN